MTMRPLHKTFTVAAVSTTGIATGLTGAGPFTTFTAAGSGDGLAHVISLTSAANLSGIDVTITGTDADGVSQTETRAGPNATTVSTTALFKTVTSISVASTLGANTLDVGWTAVSTSQTIPTEFYVDTASSVQVALTGTANFDVEVTLSNLRPNEATPSLQSAFTWTNDANFTNKSATLAANLAVTAPTAIRLVLNSYSTGAVLVLSLVTPR